MAANSLPSISKTMQSDRHIRIVVAHASLMTRQLISRTLAEAPEFDVVASACNGWDALAMIKLFHPDLVILDVEMPKLDGIGTLRRIQQGFPRVQVIPWRRLEDHGAATASDGSPDGADSDGMKRQRGELSATACNDLKADLTAKIRQLFPVKASQQAARTEVPERGSQLPGSRHSSRGSPYPERRLSPQILLIGVSTGGPAALAELLSMIPKDFPLPIAIVQHMPPFFTRLLAERLSKLGQVPVHEGAHNMELKPGQAILAPGDFHMRLVRKRGGVEIALNQDTHENSCRPAVDVLFRSAAEVYGGAAIATVLTGMGQDGLLGARALKALGAPVLVQDSQTSVVWGMPGAIAEAHLADAVLPLREIAPAILRLL